MPPSNPAKLLRVHVAESDRAGDKPLYEAIVDRCRELGIAGATVLPGLEGFGETADIQRPRVVVVVDSASNIERLVKALEGLVDGSLMAVSDVQALRVEKGV